MNTEHEIAERLREAYAQSALNHDPSGFMSAIAREIAAARGDAPKREESLAEQHERPYREWRDAVVERYQAGARGDTSAPETVREEEVRGVLLGKTLTIGVRDLFDRFIITRKPGA